MNQRGSIHPELYLLKDFNDRVGADHDTWPSSVGPQGIGRMNENGQRLLELCCHRCLCITNTYFKCHKVSWRHPRSKHWHQLYLAITRQADLHFLLHIDTFFTVVAFTVQIVTLTTPSSAAK